MENSKPPVMPPPMPPGKLAGKAPGPSKRPSLFKRKWILNQRFQWQFVLFLLFLILFADLTLYILVMGSLKALLIDPAFTAGDQVMQQSVTVLTDRIQMGFLFSLGMSSLVNFFLGIWFSHRVAGPLFRLRRELDDLAAGRTGPDLEFREGDFFPELAKSFNGVLQRLRNGS